MIYVPRQQRIEAERVVLSAGEAFVVAAPNGDLVPIRGALFNLFFEREGKNGAAVETKQGGGERERE